MVGALPHRRRAAGGRSGRRSAARTAIISRMKIMGGLNIAEKRLPQDGRIRIKIAGKDIDIRVSHDAHDPRRAHRACVCSTRAPCCSTWRTSASSETQLRRSCTSSSTSAHGIILVTGPTGSRQDDHALRRAHAHQQARPQHPHRSRTRSSTSSSGIKPDAGEPEDRPHLRQRPALLPPPGPRRHHGRRDPRPGDRRDRHPGLAHRPPRVLHRAHQRRGRRHHPPRRHGRRAVPRRLVARGRDGAAPRARACCKELPRAVPRRRDEELRNARHAPRAVRSLERRHVYRRARAAPSATRPATTAARGIYELMLVDDDVRAAHPEERRTPHHQESAVRSRACAAARGRREEVLAGHHDARGGARGSPRRTS